MARLLSPLGECDELIRTPRVIRGTRWFKCSRSSGSRVEAQGPGQGVRDREPEVPGEGMLIFEPTTLNSFRT
ncbi:hypothetical protein MOQ72_13950 [Saccharopolyspora sp. K220]|uniref:hypothetical protein n=1 Tax=Saccharopolyspora soli TaxID=2926618 RepID=UPI001F55ECA2|nr:hypothetical protein [Saccharopolyspora soli]MCI2418538.1 hypothetical protein [Saccharopolyspora soli]